MLKEKFDTLVWTGIRQAILTDQKRLQVNENELWSLEFEDWENVVNPLTSKSKHIVNTFVLGPS